MAGSPSPCVLEKVLWSLWKMALLKLYVCMKAGALWVHIGMRTGKRVHSTLRGHENICSQSTKLNLQILAYWNNIFFVLNKWLYLGLYLFIFTVRQSPATISFLKFTRLYNYNLWKQKNVISLYEKIISDRKVLNDLKSPISWEANKITQIIPY